VTPEAVQWVDAPPSLPAGAKWADRFAPLATTLPLP
jgi:hypothetical protein